MTFESTNLWFCVQYPLYSPLSVFIVLCKISPPTHVRDSSPSHLFKDFPPASCLSVSAILFLPAFNYLITSPTFLHPAQALVTFQLLPLFTGPLYNKTLEHLCLQVLSVSAPLPSFLSYTYSNKAFIPVTPLNCSSQS